MDKSLIAHKIKLYYHSIQGSQWVEFGYSWPKFEFGSIGMCSAPYTRLAIETGGAKFLFFIFFLLKCIKNNLHIQHKI